MKKRLAIVIVLGALGQANASVITYEASGWANVSYAQRYVIGDPFSGTDVRDAYGPRRVEGPRFTIDTSLFQGTSFAYSSALADALVPFPLGLGGLGTQSFYEYSVQFDRAWNVVDLRAWFDIGPGGESWYLTLDGPTCGTIKVSAALSSILPPECQLHLWISTATTPRRCAYLRPMALIKSPRSRSRPQSAFYCRAS